MAVRFAELQCKEVICVGSGQRLGFVTGVVVEVLGAGVRHCGAGALPGAGDCGTAG